MPAFTEQNREMNIRGVGIFIFYLFFSLNILISQQCPTEENVNVNKPEEIISLLILSDQGTPITTDKIKEKLKDSGIFDWQDPSLTESEKKELGKLFDAVKIMTTSRARQPQVVQNMFSSLRIVERIVNKRLKEGQISENLAAKFHWEKISNRQRRDKSYYIDKTTNMRVFNLDS